MVKLDEATQIGQMIATYEACIAASEHIYEVVRIIRTSAAEDLEKDLAQALECNVGAAREIRHLSLDRLTPANIQRLRDELPELRARLSQLVGGPAEL